ncbi:unnamed protein product [Didymodactylos carnosus]|uniref:Protein-tyrosine phosphatase receptor IA-2 ectodomain domain-containing protein n=1 Tax=Didymodactylos carnosus TaxID=1234261 RepID=A0A813XZM8_9BILA|nr:unnamed protein product [Didymodactylos carnosus]CAF3660019.1 unnamed protein product [Didymodactylos carnosus]
MLPYTSTAPSHHHTISLTANELNNDTHHHQLKSTHELKQTENSRDDNYQNSLKIRQKRQITYDYDNYVNDDDIADYVENNDVKKEGYLGCRYDINVCDDNEQCLDDGLFGQCLSGIGEGQYKNSVSVKHILSDDKLIALEITFDFLKRYQLNWRDYATQCILIRLLKSQGVINANLLNKFYVQCINEDEILDEILLNNDNDNDDLHPVPSPSLDRNENNHRRYIQLDGDLLHDPEFDLVSWKNTEKSRGRKIYDGMWYDPYINSQTSSDDFIIDLKKLPHSLFEHHHRKPKINSQDSIYMGDNRAVEALYYSDPIIDQSIMSKNPRKISPKIREKYPDLAVALQVNNNKQQVPNRINSATMTGKHGKNVQEKNRNKTDIDNNRYYKVETDKGYIVISREFKDQMEGSRLLALIAEINRWPLSIFTELNVDRDVVTFHLIDNPYRINATNVASSAINVQQNIESQLGIRIIDAGIGAVRVSR